MLNLPADRDNLCGRRLSLGYRGANALCERPPTRTTAVWCYRLCNDEVIEVHAKRRLGDLPESRGLMLFPRKRRLRLHRLDDGLGQHRLVGCD